MQYKFTNIMLISGITPATAQNHANEPYEYLQVELTFAEKGIRNPTQKPRDYIFDKDIINNMRPYLVPDPQQPNVKRLNVQAYEAAVAAGTIEDMRFVKNAFRVKVVLNMPYVRVDSNGPRLNANGQVVPITSMVVTVYRYLDPDDGQMHDVEPAEQIVQRILNARYAPYSVPGMAAPAQPQQPALAQPTGVAEQAEALQQQVANLGI